MRTFLGYAGCPFLGLLVVRFHAVAGTCPDAAVPVWCLDVMDKESRPFSWEATPARSWELGLVRPQAHLRLLSDLAVDLGLRSLCQGPLKIFYSCFYAQIRDRAVICSLFLRDRQNNRPLPCLQGMYT
ncbi:hypothetical protein B0T24DRAFT_618276 [Lasiosphaeria ovina]|uniref:Uncharacterized protein n=1 Tax=Lasiosphaeria ovina TaxID=92902 RepID=A0AAE0KHG9_9PEZI|nr:hypothetical protein B0T24DRAFT_618276 [Lasiosphaeria ovina]